MTPLRPTTFVALMAAFTATAFAVSPAAPETPGGNQGDRTTEGVHAVVDQMPSWNTMTPQERQQFLRDMQSAKTPDQCRQVMDKHRQAMADRAKERGTPAPNEPRRDMCAGMSSQRAVP